MELHGALAPQLCFQAFLFSGLKNIYEKALLNDLAWFCKVFFTALQTAFQLALEVMQMC